MKLSALSAAKYHHVLLFGAPKVGKTLLAGKLAEAGYTLDWFDLESGAGTLYQLSPEAQENINVISLRDTPSYPIAIETVLKAVKGKVSICAEHGKVNCPVCSKDSKPVEVIDMYNPPSRKHIYVFDSGTQLMNSAIAHMRKGKAEDYKFEWDDWGHLGTLMGIFYSHIQNIPANVIVITHETETEMEDGKIKLVPTGGTRNFSRGVAKHFDHVIYVDVKNRSHLAASSTTYSMNILTGSRSGVVLEDAATPSLLDIFEGKVQSPQQKQVKAVASNLLKAAGVGVK